MTTDTPATTTLVRALIVFEDDSPATFSPQAWTLEQMQAAVGGQVEFVYGVGWCALVNEDGIYRGLKPNHAATSLALAAGWEQYPAGWHLHGSAIFFGGSDAEGNVTTVTDELVALARSVGIEVAA